MLGFAFYFAISRSALPSSSSFFNQFSLSSFFCFALDMGSTLESLIVEDDYNCSVFILMLS